MNEPLSIVTLRAMPGFWPKGWEPAWLDAKRLGIKDSAGRWAVEPRSSVRDFEMRVLAKLQSALDSCTQAVGLHAIGLAQIHDVSILRERTEVTDENGAKVEFYGRRLYAMAEGSVVAGPSEFAGDIERAVEKIAHGKAVSVGQSEGLAGLVREEAPQMAEPRTCTSPRG